MNSRKEAYLDWAAAELGILDAKIGELEARARQRRVEGKLKATETVIEVRNKQDILVRRLAELRQAGDDAFDRLRGDVSAAWRELGESLQDAYSWITAH